MKIKLLTGLAGVNFSQKAGDILDVSADEGKSLIAAGFAEMVKGKAGSPESASLSPSSERAIKPKARKRTNENKTPS